MAHLKATGTIRASSVSVLAYLRAVDSWKSSILIDEPNDHCQVILNLIVLPPPYKAREFLTTFVTSSMPATSTSSASALCLVGSPCSHVSHPNTSAVIRGTAEVMITVSQSDRGVSCEVEMLMRVDVGALLPAKIVFRFLTARAKTILKCQQHFDAINPAAN